jgi:hypothetical protein
MVFEVEREAEGKRGKEKWHYVNSLSCNENVLSKTRRIELAEKLDLYNDRLNEIIGFDLQLCGSFVETSHLPGSQLIVFSMN